MTADPSPEAPESRPTPEDEARFAPKPESAAGDGETPAAAPRKRLTSSLKTVSEHVEAEEQAAHDDENAKKVKSDALFWNLCLGLVGLIVLGAGYIVYEKFTRLPDPVRDVRAELEAGQAQILQKQGHLNDVLNKTAPKEQLFGLLDMQQKTAKDLEETQQSIEKQKLRVAGIRGEIRSYYDRYRQSARAKVRGRKFDLIKTAHSQKTYLNVEITKVEKDFVRIMHEQGSTSIQASDLPDDLRELLAYGDPLNIAAMNQTDAAMRPPVIRKATPPVPAPAPAATAKKVVVDDLDPPSGAPRVETPTGNGETQPAQGGGSWVPPSHSPLPSL